MSATINYLIECNVCLVLFFAAWWMFLRKEHQFSFSRMFLMSGIILSFSLPLMHINSSLSRQVVPSMGDALPAVWLPEVSAGGETISAAAPVPATVVWSAIEGTYLAVAIVLALLFAYRLGSIAGRIRRAATYDWLGCKVAEIEDEKQTFSFFRFISIGVSAGLSESEKEKVLNHEHVHVKQFHSIDIIVMELTKIICWFNPVVIFYKKALVEAHEFEADQLAAGRMNVPEYCQLMGKMALDEAGIPMVNSFHNSMISKRIEMLMAEKRKIQGWKIASIALLLPLVFFIVACQDQVMKDVQTTAKNSTVALDVPPQVSKELQRLKSQNPGSEYVILEMNDEGEKSFQNLKGSFKNIKFMTVAPAEGQAGERKFVFLEKGTAEQFASAGTEGDVHKFVEEMPQFPGGLDSLSLYIGKHLRYPKDSRKAGIQGKVFVQFIIEKDGSVTNPEVMKGIDTACDKEAARVVAGMPKWSPGREAGEAVRVKFVLPINYALNN